MTAEVQQGGLQARGGPSSRRRNPFSWAAMDETQKKKLLSETREVGSFFVIGLALCTFCPPAVSLAGVGILFVWFGLVSDAFV